MPVLTVTVTDELYAQLQKLATDMEHTVEQCQVWALEDFIAEERPKVDADLEATADLEAGRYVTQEQVEAWVESMGTDHPLPMPVARNVPIERAS